MKQTIHFGGPFEETSLSPAVFRKLIKPSTSADWLKKNSKRRKKYL
jgi:hypothetical protein